MTMPLSEQIEIARRMAPADLVGATQTAIGEEWFMGWKCKPVVTLLTENLEVIVAALKEAGK